jgi:hypothetical protein
MIIATKIMYELFLHIVWDSKRVIYDYKSEGLPTADEFRPATINFKKYSKQRCFLRKTCMFYFGNHLVVQFKLNSGSRRGDRSKRAEVSERPTKLPRA